MIHRHIDCVIFRTIRDEVEVGIIEPQNFRNMTLLYFTGYLSLGIDLDFINGPML